MIINVHDTTTVNLYQIGCWRWKEMRTNLRELRLDFVEGPGRISRSFVVIGDRRQIMQLNRLMGINEITEPRKGLGFVIPFLAGLVIVIAYSAWAGDHDGGYGMMSDHGQNGRSDTQTSYSLRQGSSGWFTDAYGRSIFSWDYLTGETSGVGTYTDYDGGPGDETGCCEAGIGSWGSGGGTGAGARGY